MDPQHVSRLQQEQAKAVEETDTQISQIEKFKGDYKALQDRLRTLPDKLSHEVMVPIGKLALMPGQLVHTNEIMVLLGDNWFAERTAKQAREIAGRRIDELDKQLKNLKAQRKLLEPRLEFTSDLQSHAKGQGDVQEIVEEYDAEKERLWDEQHRKSVCRQREAARQAKLGTEDREEKVVQLPDADLLARLDALEKEEAEKGEFDSAGSEEAEEDNRSSKRDQVRGVSWKDEDGKSPDGEGSCEDADSDDDEDEEEDDDYVGDDSDGAPQARRGSTKTIKFSHSDTQDVRPHMVDSAGDGSIQSPADIYKLFSPASILKKSTADKKDTHPSHQDPQRTKAEGVSFTGDAQSQPESSAFLLPTQGAQKAFSGQVKEAGPGSLPASNEVTMDPPRRVSKFKAMRAAQQDPS